MRVGSEPRLVDFPSAQLEGVVWVPPTMSETAGRECVWPHTASFLQACILTHAFVPACCSCP